MTRRFGYALTETAPRVRASDGPVHTVPHHFAPGPGGCVPLPRPVTRGGVRYTHRYRWWLDRVEGTGRGAALRAIYATLRHPRSWVRAGVLFTRARRREDAQILLRVIPAATTVCGPGAAGCWSWSGVPGELPIAECGVEYLGDPVAWATILGMELALHGALAGADMYSPQHQPYYGSAGTFAVARQLGGYPTDAEIEDAREWLQGKTPPERLHDD